MIKEYDYIIIGAGIYGLYAAKLLSKNNNKIAIIEKDNEPFQRASYINQARVHNGYHYPRSYSTAIKSIKYFDKFNKDFSFAINKKFVKIYAISKIFSFTSSSQFKSFCLAVGIPCTEISSKRYFNNNVIEEAFETEEYAFDPIKIKNWFIKKILESKKVDFVFNGRFTDVKEKGTKYHLKLTNGDIYSAPAVINATYASLNQIIDEFHFDKFRIKYEICEIILCKTTINIKDIGITVMDGPFFSVMPFGLTGIHSLSAVTHTPHLTCYESLPRFICQNNNKICTSDSLENCNLCPAKPKTAWVYMNQLTKKYLNQSIKLTYKNSLFAIKPILIASEIDDSRPTMIKKFSDNPSFISILSGKINTIYDIDEILL